MRRSSGDSANGGDALARGRGSGRGRRNDAAISYTPCRKNRTGARNDPARLRANRNEWDVAMISGRSIDELARSLVGLIPPGMDQAAADVEKSMKATLMAGLRKLDLVTREEFEVQRAVLLRTREKLEQLERELDALQSQVDAAG